MHSSSVLEHVRTLIATVRALEALYPGRSFTLDGHLVGSIGEVLAAELYNLVLLPASSRCHDGTCPVGRQVQIKLTQRSRVALSEEPDFLLVLRLDDDGNVHEVYNGPGRLPWAAAGREQKNGQRSISIAKLIAMSSGVAAEERIALVAKPAWYKLGSTAKVHGSRLNVR